MVAIPVSGSAMGTSRSTNPTSRAGAPNATRSAGSKGRRGAPGRTMGVRSAWPGGHVEDHHAAVEVVDRVGETLTRRRGGTDRDLTRGDDPILALVGDGPQRWVLPRGAGVGHVHDVHGGGAAVRYEEASAVEFDARRAAR